MKIRFAVYVGAIVSLAFLIPEVSAGPKGTVLVPAIQSGSITIDGKIDDWPLASYTTVARQPVYPEALENESTDAFGDHIVWELDRISGFNGSIAADWDPESLSEFGASVYFAYDENFLYGLGVFIDDEVNGSRDEGGFSNFLNDGLEIFIDAKGDSDDPADEAAFPNFDTEFDEEDLGVTANTDDFQLTVGVNEFFEGGAEQHLERGGDPDIIKEGYLDIRGETDLSSVGGKDIALEQYSNLGAAGALNPEVLANPDAALSGYAVEWVVPFNLVDGFTPDHDMGFEIFFRDTDDPDDPDPGMGGAGIFWTDWTQNESVASDLEAEIPTGLFHTGTWGKLQFVGSLDPTARLDDGSLTDSTERADYVHNVLGTWIGDSNFDGEFNSTDFVEVFTAGQYEDDLEGNSTWATGDWNGDSEFNSSDFVAAFGDAGYEAGLRGAAAVPEPSSFVLLLIGVLAFVRRRR